jgi:hypothetical protein
VHPFPLSNSGNCKIGLLVVVPFHEYGPGTSPVGPKNLKT